MAILKEPYEISVWDNDTRLMVIGTDKMTSQNRAIEPMLTTNVNGQKAFSFKMYKRYVDIVSGEEVENLFCGYLINEREVKLKHNGEWHDFIIKNVVEDSNSYLNTYQLTDAIVEELSKNGYDVTLDAQQMNNIGTAGELAARVVEGTDWTVESEAFVEKIEEALVYVGISKERLTQAKKIKDQTVWTEGISIVDSGLNNVSEYGELCLAFYSSCVDKPHRFQFIYLKDYENVAVNDKRIIQARDCQYFIEIDKPDSTYKEVEEYWLPEGIDLPPAPSEDTQVSSKYRGERIGFAQKQVYVPLLNRYVREYSGYSITETKYNVTSNAGSSDKNTRRYEIDIPEDIFSNVTYKMEYEIKSGDSLPNEFFGGFRLSNCPEGKLHTSSIAHSNGEILFDDLVDRINACLTRTPEARVESIYISIPNDSTYTDSTFKLAKLTLTKTYKKIYGYSDAEYITPNIQQNFVANASFEGTSGWEYDKSGGEITVESVYGKFDGDNKFTNSVDELKKGNTDWTGYQNCLKITCNASAADGATNRDKYRVINTGLFDNRTVLKNLKKGDELMLRAILKWPETNATTCGNEFNFLSFYFVDKELNGYTYQSTDEVIKAKSSSNDVYSYGTILQSNWTEEEFKKHKLRLVLDLDKFKKGYAIQEGEVFYLTRAELYKVHRDAEGNIIFPDENTNLPKSETIYNFLDPAYVDEDSPIKVNSKEEIPYIETARTRDYSVYKPIYNDDGQRIQTVSTKESNRFNILQSIAETFKCWLKFDIGRGDNGQIESKKIYLKNYSGDDNYAAFRYGVNLKNIQRTYESKDIVTKLIVKPNKNSLAENGSCTIQLAGANPTGEDYIYDFGYYQNQGLMKVQDYIDYVYGPGKHFDVLRTKNNELLEYTRQINALSAKLNELTATQEAEEALMSAALEERDSLAEKFKAESGGVAVEDIKEVYSVFTAGEAINDIPITAAVTPGASLENKKGHYTAISELDWVANVGEHKSIAIRVQGTKNAVFGTVTKDGDNNQEKLWYKDGVLPQVLVTIRTKEALTGDAKKTINLVLYPEVVSKSTDGLSGSTRVQSISFVKELSSETASSPLVHNVYVPIYPYESNSNTENYLQAYAQALGQYQTLTETTESRKDDIDSIQDQLNTLKSDFEAARKDKFTQQQNFYKKYSRFIKEGTWQSEEHIDANKYYIDAQSVLYNSCYPQAAYTINVVSMSQVPGYEMFKFKLGEKTRVEDGEFFGYDENGYPISTEVIISEKIDFLDTPDKNTIKVQNFKDQFQDLFQKITATVQQTQYNTGAYKEAVALTEAKEGRNVSFLRAAMNEAREALNAGGDNSVTWGKGGITVRNNKGQAIRLVGGAILLGSGEDGAEQWSTGLTANGISADKVTAGTIDTNHINIMAGNDVAFVLNNLGLTAFDQPVGTATNPSRFVRFDKHGLYGITDPNWNAEGVDASTIDNNANFALTWEGLKVTGSENVVARIGKQDGKIISVKKGAENVFSVDNNGNVFISGEVNSNSGEIGGFTIGNLSLVGKSEKYSINQIIKKIDNGVLQFSGPLPSQVYLFTCQFNTDMSKSKLKIEYVYNSTPSGRNWYLIPTDTTNEFQCRIKFPEISESKNININVYQRTNGKWVNVNTNVSTIILEASNVSFGMQSMGQSGMLGENTRVLPSLAQEETSNNNKSIINIFTGFSKDIEDQNVSVTENDITSALTADGSFYCSGLAIMDSYRRNNYLYLQNLGEPIIRGMSDGYDCFKLSSDGLELWDAPITLYRTVTNDSMGSLTIDFGSGSWDEPRVGQVLGVLDTVKDGGIVGLISPFSDSEEETTIELQTSDTKKHVLVFNKYGVLTSYTPPFQQ